MSNLSLDQSIITALQSAWSRIEQGSVEIICLKGQLGSGINSLVRDFQNQIGSKCLTWHVGCSLNDADEDMLPKIIDGLWKNIRQSQSMTHAVSDILSQAMAKATDAAEEERLLMLNQSLHWNMNNKGMQTILPQNRPLMSLVELGLCIAAECQLLVYLEDVHFNQGLCTYAWLDALISKLPPQARVLVLITAADSRHGASFLPIGVQHLLQKHKGHSIWETPFNKQEIGDWLKTHGIQDQDKTWFNWTQGQPGRLMEIHAWLAKDKRSTIPKTIDHWEKATLAAGMCGLSIPVHRLSLLLGTSTDETLNALESDMDAGQCKLISQSNTEQKWTFHTATHAEKARIAALKHKYFSKRILEKLEAQTFTNDTYGLFQLLQNHADLNNPEGVDRVQSTFLRKNGDQMWLHLADLAFGEELEWPTELQAKALTGGLRHLIDANNAQAEKLFIWGIEWTKRHNKPTTAIEILRIVARQFNQDSRYHDAKELLNNALEIAQDISSVEHNISIRLDLAEAAAVQKIGQDMNAQLLLLKNAPLTPIDKIKSAMIEARFSEGSGNLNQALNNWLNVRKTATDTHINHIAADAGLRVAEIHIKQGNPDLAEELLEKISIEVKYDLHRANRCRDLRAATHKQAKI